MRKFKALALTVLILSLPVAAFPAAGVSAREFSDVPITASYYTAVDKLSNIGVIQGREDGNFAPEAQTTRAEFCAFLSRATGYNENYYQASTTPFTDVSADYWANSYISYCYDRGYINGNLDNTFAPADPVTYEQVVKMVVCSSGAGDDSLRSVGPYWYSGYLAVADKYGLLHDTTKAVGKDANRAFVAQMIYNSLSFINGGEIDDSAPVTDAEDLSNNAAHSTAVPQSTEAPKEEIFEATPAPTTAPTAAPTTAHTAAPTAAPAITPVPNETNVPAGTALPTPLPTRVPTPRPTAVPTAVPTAPPAAPTVAPAAAPQQSVPQNVPVWNSVYQPNKTIVIDPGHNYSGVDTGATGNGLREQDITWYIADKVKPLLEAHGFNVVMTRNSITDNCSTASTSESLAYRYNLANNLNAALFVSIHCNAGGSNGTETYCYYNSSEGRKLAQSIQGYIIGSVGTVNRGVKEAGFAVIRHTTMPAVLVETAFIDTADDAAKLGDSGYQQLYAESIVHGICDYMGVAY